MHVGFGRYLDVGSVLSQKQKVGPTAHTSASSSSVRNNHTNGTVVSRKDFHGEQAARNLHEALCGRDVDASTVIDVLATHTNRQRQAIDRHYKVLGDKGLRADISEKLGGYVRKISLMLLQHPAEFLAREVHRALQRVTPEIDTLIGLLWGRSNNKIEEVKTAYINAFGRPLEEVVRRELAADLRPLGRVLVEGQRDPQGMDPDDVDLLQARKDAQYWHKLYGVPIVDTTILAGKSSLCALIKPQALANGIYFKMLSSGGVGLRYGTEAPALVKILQIRSHSHLQEMLQQYDMMSERNMEASIVAEFSGRLQGGLLSLVKMIRDPIMFLTEYIHEAIQDSNPNDSKLIQVIIARSEIDLADIKDSYLLHYGVKLVSDVSDVTTNGYRKYLIRLLGHYDE